MGESKWIQAMDLVSAVCSDIYIDPDDPMGMAKKIVAEIVRLRAERDELRAEVERLRSERETLKGVVGRLSDDINDLLQKVWFAIQNPDDETIERLRELAKRESGSSDG
jgi:uncharacterized coiled-coil DUF342 family protein